MKNWIMELCPEIAEWQAELIAEECEKRVQAALSAKQGEQDALLDSTVTPHALYYPLSDYHRAPSDGPLNFTWIDKPHRLLYDLIAAVKFYANPAPVNAQEVRLWDSQWVNVVNHDNAYRDWSKEDAINHAVKMTEKLIAENVNGNKLPPAPVNTALLEDIAEVAHCGGLVGMSEGDALICIRKLTLPHWRKERTIEQARAAIAEASTQPEIQTDTLERKDAALRVALEALETCGEYEDSDGDRYASFSESQVEEAIAKIKEAL